MFGVSVGALNALRHPVSLKHLALLSALSAIANFSTQLPFKHRPQPHHIPSPTHEPIHLFTLTDPLIHPLRSLEYGFVASSAADWTLSDATTPMPILFTCFGLASAAAGKWQDKVT